MNYTGEGIMAQINSLVALPQMSSTSGGNRKDTSGYKKVGRSHKDVCVACGDGGDMLSCESCSTTMHCLCADPPIDEDEVRPPRWKCRTCVYVLYNQTEFNLASPGASKGVKKKIGKKKVVKPDPQLQVTLLALDQSKKQNTTTEGGSNSSLGNIFKVLMPEVRKLNPVEFSLPSDYSTYDHQFPGSSRQLYKKSSGAKPKPLVMKEADVTCHKANVFCFSCNQSCRLKSLIKCDYCSAYFHFDCLNPPLITAPIGYWQCPLHVEPFLEQNTLQTTKLTERVQLWEKARDPVQPASIISKFFRKVYNPNPMFHHKVEMNRSKLADIPDFVVGVYDRNLYEAANSQIDHNKHINRSDSFKFSTLKRNADDLVSSTIEIPDSVDPPQSKNNIKCSLTMLADAVTVVESSNEYVKKLDLETIKKLAYRKVVEMKLEELNKNKREMEPIVKRVRSMQQTPVERPLSTIKMTQMRPVLSLICINSMKKFILRSKSISIGSGDAVTINLSKVSNCRGVSVRHANIAYDSLLSRWDLVNYSPHGTIVDDCFLGCDFTPELREPQKYVDFPEFCLKKYLIDRNKASIKSYSKPKSVVQNCPCSTLASPSLRSWEGPIPLKEKSRIQIGCVVLLVITTDYMETEVTKQVANSRSIEKKVNFESNRDHSTKQSENFENPVEGKKKAKAANALETASEKEKVLKSDGIKSIEVGKHHLTEDSMKIVESTKGNKEETPGSKKIDDKDKITSNLIVTSKCNSKNKIKREVAFPAHSLTHPYSQPRLIHLLEKLTPAELSPKKLVNYFDTKGSTKKSTEIPNEVKVVFDSKLEEQVKKKLSEGAPKTTSEGSTGELEIIKDKKSTDSNPKKDERAVARISDEKGKVCGTPAKSSSLSTKCPASIPTKFGPVFKP